MPRNSPNAERRRRLTRIDRKCRDEMADFDADMERDEALDLHRKRELIKAWLSPQKGSRQ
jgi:hypothetical protein